jgi:hypothetical protein
MQRNLPEQRNIAGQRAFAPEHHPPAGTRERPGHELGQLADRTTAARLASSAPRRPRAGWLPVHMAARERPRLRRTSHRGRPHRPPRRPLTRGSPLALQPPPQAQELITGGAGARSGQGRQAAPAASRAPPRPSLVAPTRNSPHRSAPQVRAKKSCDQGKGVGVDPLTSRQRDRHVIASRGPYGF